MKFIKFFDPSTEFALKLEGLRVDDEVNLSALQPSLFESSETVKQPTISQACHVILKLTVKTNIAKDPLNPNVNHSSFLSLF